MTKPLETCKNCEQQFNDEFNFCPHCGQQAKDELTVKVLFYNTISNYFSFDARFLKSFLPLLFRPGYLALKFIQGKRLLYLHPAQMYLFIAVVFFFLFSFIQRNQVRDLDEKLAKTLKKNQVIENIADQKLKDSIENARVEKKRKNDSIAAAAVKQALQNTKLPIGIEDKQLDSIFKAEKIDINDPMTFDFNTKVVDSLIEAGAAESEIYNAMGIGEDPGYFKRRLYAQGLKFYKSRKGGSILQAFYDTIPIAMFFLLPIFAFILKLLHLRRGTYAHHLVFSFYYFSFLFTVFSIILAVNYIIDIPDWIDFLIMLSTFIYLILALKRFYMQGWFKSLFKGAITSFVFLSIVTPITLVLLSFFAFLFY